MLFSPVIAYWFPGDIFKVEFLQSTCVVNLSLSGNFHSEVVGDYGGGKLKINMDLLLVGKEGRKNCDF